MKDLNKTYLINSTLDKVWQALVDPKIIDEWGGGPAKMDDKVGTDFSLWGGDIHGTNIKVLNEEELVQDWFGGEWKKPSKVVFKLRVKENQIQLELIQKNIPDSDYSDIADGWDRYYIGPLKKLVEN